MTVDLKLCNGGVAWRSCFSHLGWRFTSTLTDAELPVFWGLSRRSIDDRSASETEAEQAQRAAGNVGIPLRWEGSDFDEDEEENEREAGAPHVRRLLQLLGHWLDGAHRTFAAHREEDDEGEAGIDDWEEEEEEEP